MLHCAVRPYCSPDSQDRLNPRQQSKSNFSGEPLRGTSCKRSYWVSRTSYHKRAAALIEHLSDLREFRKFYHFALIGAAAISWETIKKLKLRRNLAHFYGCLDCLLKDTAKSHESFRLRWTSPGARRRALTPRCRLRRDCWRFASLIGFPNRWMRFDSVRLPIAQERLLCLFTSE